MDKTNEEIIGMRPVNKIIMNIDNTETTIAFRVPDRKLDLSERLNEYNSLD